MIIVTIYCKNFRFTNYVVIILLYTPFFSGILWVDNHSETHSSSHVTFFLSMNLVLPGCLRKKDSRIVLRPQVVVPCTLQYCAHFLMEKRSLLTRFLPARYLQAHAPCLVGNYQLFRTCSSRNDCWSLSSSGYVILTLKFISKFYFNST